MENNINKVTFFMLVTNRDCIIADYAIKSYEKIYNEKRKYGYKDFQLFIYLNCLSEENLAFYYDKWANYPFSVLYNNAEKIAAMKVKPYPGQTIISPEGMARKVDDYAESYDELWSTELQKFNTPYIATVDADFEVLDSDFYFDLMNKLSADEQIICASSCYGQTLTEPVYDTYSKQYIYQNERNNTWFCIYKKEAFELSKISHYYFERKTEDGKIMVYDSASYFQDSLRKKGFKFIAAPPQYFGSFVHYGAASKNKSLTRLNIGHYRNAFLIATKGLIKGKNNLLIRIINKISRKIGHYLYDNFLSKIRTERSTYIYTEE
ncbi:MAG: hypothetical protein V4663_00455 [Bacteroidota bacterium]